MSTEFQIVSTPYGPVKGFAKATCFDRKYFSFLGIPYARQPIGERRFRDAEEVQPWSEEFDATAEGQPCHQTISRGDDMPSMYIGNDTCLVLNVYTKELRPERPLPVLVYIHGGGFMGGSSSRFLYGPDYIMEKDVLLVTINYRVGIFGFLSLADPEVGVPGNAGLKDQVLALKWVQKCVASFGGDPGNVTLFGESAGGASVHYHMVSEASKGLFHRAILMSGTMLSPWAFQPPGNNRTLRLARAIGYQGDGSDKSVYEFLLATDPIIISPAQEKNKLLTEEELQSGLISTFGPTIEPYKTKNTFLPDHPLILMRNAWSKDIDIIISGVADEGLFFYGDARPEAFRHIDALVAAELGQPITSDSVQQKTNELKISYFGSLLPSNNVDKYIEVRHATNTADKRPIAGLKFKVFQLLGDRSFWHGIHRTVMSRLNVADAKGRTFLYRYAVELKEENLLRTMFKIPFRYGTVHGEDLLVFFKPASAQHPEENELHMKTIQRMVKLVYDFALNGNVQMEEVNWEPVQKESPLKCLNIAAECQVIPLPETRRIAIWDQIHDNKGLY